MRELTEVRALLARLDQASADALESQDLDFKEWPADDRHAVRLAVDMAVCMANGGGGTVVLGVLDRIAARQREARISDLADLAIVQDAGAYASAYRRLGWTDLQSAVRHAGQQLARALPA